jgi:RHS repeat-associated protein
MQVYSVDPSSGSVSSNALTTNVWFDHRGDTIATAAPGGLVTKTQFDGAGRPTATYQTDGAGGSSWANASSVSSDNVLAQTQNSYDANGNVLLQTTRQRFDNETATGALGNPSTSPKARVSYVASYYDAANRPTASVDVGTNGGSAYTRPSSVPSPSDTVLVTSYAYAADNVQQVALTGAPTGGTFTLTFGGQTTSAIAYNASAATVQADLQALSSIGSGNVLVMGGSGGPWTVRFAGSLAGTAQAQLTASGSGLTGGTSPSVSVTTSSVGGDAGRVQTTTDPRGIVSKTDYDLLGRTVRTVQAFTNFVPSGSDNAITEFTYDGDAHTLTVQADQPNGAFEQTQFVYGVTTSGGSDVNSNDVLKATYYPDPSTGVASSSQAQTQTVNALGDTKTVTDRNGNVHTYTYDVLGRQISDAVTTLGSGVDGSVRRIDTAYDTQGNPYLLTSYDAASGGNVVNQVQRAYNGLGQLTAEYQSHSGAVNTSTTPVVQYGYNLMSGGANNSRLTSMTYPNGRVLTYNYASGVDSSISRLTSISDSSATLESYTYLGLATVVQRAHPQIGVNLTYIAQTSGTTGDAGDKYIGLDRFGRVDDQLWLNTSTSTTTDEFQYGYDRDSNVLYKQNTVDAVFSELYHANGASNGYNALNELVAFSRGTLSSSGGGVPDTVSSPSRSLSWTLDALGNFSSVTTNGTGQSRTHNQQNEVTGVGSATLTFDSNGNLTTDENGNQLKYDAWNRLVQVKNSGGTVLASYQYDALGRRIVESVGGTTTDPYYSAQGQVLEERVGGQARAQYVWSPVYVNALIERDRDPTGSGTLSERLYVQQDADWNVTALVNTSGQVVERYIYDPYGQVTILDASWNTRSSSSYAWRYLFQGERYEAATGLYHTSRRDESATLGRWIEADPLGYVDGLNYYAAEGNQPTDRTDPSGETWSIVVEQGYVWVRTDSGTTSIIGRDLGEDRVGILEAYGGGVISLQSLTTIASRIPHPQVTFTSRLTLLENARLLDRRHSENRLTQLRSMAEWPRAFDPNVNGQQAGQMAIDASWSMVREAGLAAGAPFVARALLPAERAVYEAARGGGRHAGLLRRFQGERVHRIQASIVGHDAQVRLHLDKIANPARHVHNWAAHTADQQRWTIRGWIDDAVRNAEQASVLRCLLETVR